MSKEERYKYHCDEYDYVEIIYDNEECEEIDSMKMAEKRLNRQQDKISDLEAKLAEKDDELLQKEKKIQDLMLCEFVATTLDFNKLSADNCRLRDSILDLEAKLAEKDTEIDVYKKYIKEEDQYKISFAVEQLEKGKEWVNEMFNGWKNNEEVNPFAKDGICLALETVGYKIDNQIKAIKGEK